AHRRALPRVGRQAQDLDGRQPPLVDGVRGAVGGAIVHNDDLVGFVTAFEVGDHRVEKRRKTLRLVERRDDDRPAGRHRMREASTRRRRRAVAVSCAARATPSATAGATLLLKTLGMMYSSESSLRLTHAASARAAASFISSLTTRARASSSPRKNPGKHST